MPPVASDGVTRVPMAAVSVETSSIKVGKASEKPDQFSLVSRVYVKQATITYMNKEQLKHGL